ncbi:nucleoside phosphorylase [Oligoflexus tunisiensis]|uniref:nucleoside phosphorylase n=1 Tax=Oligoflexus tunisiensis TaxID=708132 RepID=UPI000AC94543|nr:nucleoside phosphorylase [Oligoflexus tunisiensis]
MQSTSPLQPMHMNITSQDLQGNGRLGRYILLPGSDGRAEAIAQRLQNVKMQPHSRRHNFYIGSWQGIDIGVMSSGMGCPSMDIIATELLHQGARRIIRVGTAGSLQPQRLRIGSLVVPTAAVRDEGTSRHYLDRSIPVLASLEFLDAVRRAAVEHKLNDRLFMGLTHTKDSLYAREFGEGPLQAEHERYMQHLQAAGVLASEMECAQLFTLTQVWNQKLLQTETDRPLVRSGAILAVIGDDQPFADGQEVKTTIERAIDLGFATIASWHKNEDRPWL